MNTTCLSVGDRLGSFTLVRKLGEGADANVWLARMPSEDGFCMPVALKVLKTKEDDTARKSLDNEARLGSLLQHPSIAKVFGLKRLGPHTVLVMEFVEGWTLREVLDYCESRRQRMPESAIIDLFLSIAEGLAYAHGMTYKGEPAPVIHRDLKPANIMIAPDGAVKICDLGIAKSRLNRHQTQADSRMTKGSPAYMSPEQAQNHDLDGRSDIFALGSVLYNVLTGKLLFDGPTALDVLKGVVTVDTVYLDDASRGLEGSGLVRVYKRCARKDPDERYQDVHALMRELYQLRAEVEGPTFAEWMAQTASRLREVNAITGQSFAALPSLPPENVHEADSLPELPAAAQENQSTSQQIAAGVAWSVGVPLVIALVLATVFVYLLPLFAEQETQQAVSEPEVAPSADDFADLVPESSLADAFSDLERTPAPIVPRVRPQAPTQKEAEPTEDPTPVAEGLLSLNARPWAWVSLNGKRIGQTPMLNHRLPAGDHELVFECGACVPTERRTVSVTVREGETVKRIVTFGE